MQDVFLIEKDRSTLDKLHKLDFPQKCNFILHNEISLQILDRLLIRVFKLQETQANENEKTLRSKKKQKIHENTDQVLDDVHKSINETQWKKMMNDLPFCVQEERSREKIRQII